MENSPPDGILSRNVSSHGNGPFLMGALSPAPGGLVQAQADRGVVLNPTISGSRPGSLCVSASPHPDTYFAVTTVPTGTTCMKILPRTNGISWPDES